MVSQLPAQKDGEKPTPENLSDTFSENSYGSIDSSDTNSSADSGNSSGSDSSAESDNSAGSYTSCDIERDIEMEIARSYSYPESEKCKIQESDVGGNAGPLKTASTTSSLTSESATGSSSSCFVFFGPDVVVYQQSVDVEKPSTSSETFGESSSTGSRGRKRRRSETDANVAKLVDRSLIRLEKQMTKQRLQRFHLLRLSHQMSSKLQILIDMPPVSKAVQLMHAWNDDDKSSNIFILEDKLTLHRNPVAQLTDCIRGRASYEVGVHLFEVTWPAGQRGTHAVVGVGTAEAPLQCFGYQSLVGSDEHSWGWDLVQLKAIHQSNRRPANPYPAVFKPHQQFEVPDKFRMMLDMDEGVMGFIIEDTYLGPAFRGLRGKKLFVTVSAVWGNSEIKMKYIGGLGPEPISLKSLCRHTIRQKLGKDLAGQQAKIQELNLPITIKDFLKFKDRDH